MKILPDECLPVDFRHSFPGHDTSTVQWAGLTKRQEKWRIAPCAEVAGYGVVLTVDQGIPQQVPYAGRKLSIVLIQSRTNQIEDLLPLAPAIMEVLEFLQPGQIVVVPLKG